LRRELDIEKVPGAAFLRTTAQSRPVILALEHADLLAQRQDFQSQTISATREGTQPPKETYDEFEHEGNLHGPLVI
jgi:hypothetical protein